MIGVPRWRSGSAILRPSSGGPAYTPTTATTFLPCTSAGRNGAGGAVVRFDERRHLVRQVCGVLAVPAQDLGRLVAREEDRTGEDRRPDAMEPELEGGHDPEVPAPAAKTPVQLRVLVLAGAHEPTVRRDEVRRLQVVAGQAVLAHEPADPAAEREAGDAGRRDETPGQRQPERLRFVIELSPGHAALSDDALGVRVHPDALHRGQIDDDPAVGRGEPREAVSTTANGDLELLAPRELDGGDDVGDAGAADDERRTPVDHRVPDGPSLVVARVGWRDHLTQDALAKLLDCRIAKDRSHRVLLSVDRLTWSRMAAAPLIAASRPSGQCAPPMTGAIIWAPVSMRTSSPAATPAWTCATVVYGMSAASKAGPGTARISVHEPV